MKKIIVLFVVIISGVNTFAQSGKISGIIKDAENGDFLPFVNVLLEPSKTLITTDENGYYQFTNLAPNLYSVTVSFIGYQYQKKAEIQVTNNNPQIINFSLLPQGNQLEVVEVKISAFEKNPDIPMSSRSLGIAEIERNPGGNRDISKVIQSLPGVAQGVAFRNDLIVRGGGPNENRFFLEDIETPNINHFATQGASGGPVGMLDINYIRNVEFLTSSFPANNYNTLSSVMKIKFKNPRTDRLGLRGTFGASDFGLSAEGPISDKTTFFISARRSYLQLLFKAIGLPFLPVYNDLLYKVKTEINSKTEFYTIFLGSYDDSELNLDRNETPEQRYILSYLPSSGQRSYTNGYVVTRYHKKGFTNFVLSRNMLFNKSMKYIDNIETTENKILDYYSTEGETKFRIENKQTRKGFSINSGINSELAKYTNSTYNRIALPTGLAEFNYNSELNIIKYGAFIHTSKNLFSNRISLTGGIRTDFNNYSKNMSQPLEQLSPRFGASYNINESIKVNSSWGIYYQLPSYVTMGFKDNNGNLINKENELKYIRARHLAVGTEFLTKFESRFSVEGFYKKYSNYTFSLVDSISIANFGGDFGVVGNVPANSSSNGRTYGLELLYQQKMYKGFYGIVAYTFVRSEFEDKQGNLVPSSWDSRHIVSLTAGKKFKREWSIGFKWRFSTGTPYTPYDVVNSSLIANYNVQPQGFLDYNRANSERISNFHQLDFRIDKKYYWDKINVNFYFDIQNSYNFQTELRPNFEVVKDASFQPIVDPNNPNSYQSTLVSNTTGTLLPTLGIIIEF